MSKLFRQAHYLTSAFEISQCPPDEGIEIAFAGRSNSGKSTAINCLTQQKGLCKTSKTPGRTQLINFFSLDDQRRLVDLPGYGYAKVPKKLRQHWNTVLSEFLLNRKALAGLIILVDIRRGLAEMDFALIDMLEGTLSIHILLTKSDKLSRSTQQKILFKHKEEFNSDSVSLSVFSALNKQGLTELENQCFKWLEMSQ